VAAMSIACGGEPDPCDVDEDGDGSNAVLYHCPGKDCDDDDPGVNESAAEVAWDGIDNDCADGDLKDYRAVALGWSAFGCGIKKTGELVCWGSNKKGGMDAPTGQFKTVALGRGVGCGIRDDDTISCWGNGRYGPIKDVPNGPFASVAVGDGWACALNDEGIPSCFGEGFAAPQTAMRSIAVDLDYACGIQKADGALVCWGEVPDLALPTGVFDGVESAHQQTCAWSKSGDVTCFGVYYCTARDLGTNCVGRLDDLPRAGFSIPKDLPPISELALGEATVCALIDTKVRCWMSENHSDSKPPKNARFSSLSASNSGLCGLTADGMLTCWGYSKSRAIMPPK